MKEIKAIHAEHRGPRLAKDRGIGLAGVAYALRGRSCHD